MKKHLLLFAGLAVMMASCTSNQAEKKGRDSSMIAVDTTFSPTNRAPENSVSCYQYVKNKDTANMQLRINGEEITGTLDYYIHEKDANKGTFSGEMKGDTLIADYTFDSEGLRSVREVVFLKKDGKFYEGYGPVKEDKGKVMFEHRGSLKFDNNLIFSPIPCP
ncbi:hypothetical protein [Pedobacter gandavensis]|uniref:Lipoprotein n=1 Tax=Pedobacter gandavensis TaxID=2679963 RepID=A0ABR6EW76_9SPHI|nr:hypothetical protein [Pedobacter gandavensis]MBB2149499.1 hypothetical protein [Pedobacter gandavensis]